MNTPALHEVSTHCPYCGESISLLIDCSCMQQDYIEDCQVCCRPITVKVMQTLEDEPEVHLFQENETP